MNETKPCPFCGKEIKAVAKKCKHCGRWLEEPALIDTTTHSGINNDVKIENSTSNKIVWGVIAGVGLLIVILIIIFASQKSDYDYASDEYDSVPAEEVGIPVTEGTPVYESGTPYPYDGIPDGQEEYYYPAEENHAGQGQTYYNDGDNANSWE